MQKKRKKNWGTECFVPQINATIKGKNADIIASQSLLVRERTL